ARGAGPAQRAEPLVERRRPARPRLRVSSAAVKPAAVLAVIAVLVYLPSLAGPFHFDDYNVIVHYPTVHEWGSLFERAGAGVRAVLKASYTLNWTLDPSPFGFH